jgi:hypothetical protein
MTERAAGRMRSMSQMNALLNSAVNELERVVTPELQRKSYANNDEKKQEKKAEKTQDKQADDRCVVVPAVSAEERKLVEQLMHVSEQSSSALITPRSLFGDAFETAAPVKPAPVKQEVAVPKKSWGNKSAEANKNKNETKNVIETKKVTRLNVSVLFCLLLSCCGRVFLSVSFSFSLSQSKQKQTD